MYPTTEAMALASLQVPLWCRASAAIAETHADAVVALICWRRWEWVAVCRRRRLLWLIRVATNATEDAVDEKVTALPTLTTAAADGFAPSPHVVGSTGPSTEGVAARSSAGSAA